MIGTLRTPKRAVLDFRKNMLSVVQVLILSTACFIATGNGLPEKVVTTESPADMVLPPYCTPTFSWTMEPICNVTFNTINNNSSCVVGSGPFYNNYSGISTTVTKGVSYPISVSGNTDGPYTNRINVFIDFNQDNDFSDPGEEFQLGNIVNCGNCAVTGTILIPATALTGNTTMRVMKRFNQYATPCNTEGWGEVEDYVLNIQNSGPPLALSISSASICTGQSATTSITPATFGNYNQYTWSPAGVTGTAPNFTFSPATTTTYTLTGLNTATLATNTATFTVNVNPAPSVVNVTPAAPSICPGGIATLTASGGTVSGVTAFSENFNGPATGWTTQTTGSPNPWYLYPNNSYVFLNSIISNDASGFAAVDSDAGGSGSTTISSLISPSFSLASYTTASLNFWHFYRYFNGPESGEVQISTNGGATYTTVLTITANAGAATNFANANVSLNTFVGQPDVRIRFRYTASWDFGWAIDNIVVTGNATSGVTWSPAAGLFTNAAGTIPYTGGVTNTVYASPTNTTIYTATATNSVTGCTRTRQVTVTVPLVPGTISNNQIVCGGLAENIILTGHTGTVVTWQSAPDPSFTTGVTNIPGSAGATTLFSATIGNVTAPMYIRAQILGGTCTAYTNSVFLDVISATWNGTTWTPAPPTSTTKAIFTGNYSSTGDLQACSVLVTSGDVVFNSGHNLIVQNEVVVDNEVIATGKSLSFEDDASLVQFNDAAINSGTIIYKRNSSPMIQYDYTYWSSPVYPQTLVGLSPMTLADKYFWWNPTTYNWQSIAAPGITVMTPALGYIIRAPQGFTAVPQVYPGVFNGVPNNGVISIGIQVNGLNDNNLLGNPYPSAIDADLLLSPTGPNASVLEGTIYFWTHNTPIAANQYIATDYAMYNLTGGTGTGTAGGGTGNSTVPDGKIAAGQGFFIKGQTSGTVIFNNSMRIVGNNDLFFRSSTPESVPQSVEKHRIWLELTNSYGAYKQTLVGYIETATNELDTSFDGEVMESGNVISLYSFANIHKLGIQGRALPFEITDEVPLGYRSDIAGSFNIALSDYDGLFVSDDINIYLEDKLLNVFHNLKNGAYAFTTNAGTFDHRFVLRYSSESLDVPSDNYSNFVVYRNGAGINIYSPQLAISEVKIYDLRGRLLLNVDGFDRNEIIITNLSAASQVLLVQVKTSDSKIYNRKIVF